MRNPLVKFALVAGAAAVAVFGLMVLGGGKAAGRKAPDRAQRPVARRTAPSGAPVAGNPGTTAAVRRTAAASAEAGPVAPDVLRRAREMYQRLEQACGRTAGLPEDLRRDLLAFLAEGEENRTALFRLAWEPTTHRMVAGQLGLLFRGLEDRDLGRDLLAAFEALDPGAGVRAEMASRSRDPSVLAADLAAMPSGPAKAERIRLVSKSALADERLKESLLETARYEPDEETRGAAYAKLAEAAVPEAVPVLARAAGDPGRSTRDRQMAAFCMGIHPVKPAPADLLRLYEESPAEVRLHLLGLLAATPADPRVDDLLLEALAAADGEQARRQASNALGIRIFRLPAAGARELGSRIAGTIKALTPESAAVALQFLGNSILRNEPLREVVVDLHRSAPAGGAVQLAIASSPALRSVAGVN